MSSRNSQTRTRTRNPKTELDVIAVFCEGSTENQYFSTLKGLPAFRGKVTLNVKPVGRQGHSLLSYAKQQIRKMSVKPDVVWIVFDKDAINNSELAQCIAESTQGKYPIRIGFSNRQFEVWLLSHFTEVKGSYLPERLDRELSECLRRQYKKADQAQIEKILDHLDTAVSNTAKFADIDTDEKNYLNDPYTNIAYLIRQIKDSAVKQAR
ncbi:MAG: RloB family protein [Bifidobacterium sp.]|jgi:hypothetical protein